MDHYHQPRPVPYRRYAGTVTYMERLSSEDCVCLRHRWDVLCMYNLLG